MKLPRLMNWRPGQATAATVLATTLLLSGCGAMNAQNPSGNYRPVNAVAEEPDGRLLLKGADVVAYFSEGRYVQGSPEFRSTHEGVGLRFASAASKAAFDADPKRYLPQFGGYCANGIVYGIPWGGDADTFKVIDGKLYIFGGKGSKDAFELDVPGNLALANQYWTQEVAGSNSFFQRAKRLVLRVPHYKSGEELARMVAEGKK